MDAIEMGGSSAAPGGILSPLSEPSRVGRTYSRRTGLTRHQAVIIAVLLLALVFYLWTGASTYPITFAGQGVGPAATSSAPGLARAAYNLLATALLHGHLSLPIHPDAQFLRLKHPYQDGGAIQNKKYHDLMWRNGHFYSAWGPSPVVLFLAVRILSFGSLAMSQTLAVVVYSFIGLVGSVVLLHLLVRRLLPRTPDWLLVVATIGMATMNVAPFLLRRPAQYEVAISGAYAFEMVGLCLLALAAWSDSRWRLKLSGGSLCLGLAVAARPTMLAGAVLLIAVVVWMLKSGREHRAVLLTALMPFVVCGVLLAAYNALRFGSPLNLGYAYQLATPAVNGRQINDPAYLLPGLFGYLLMPPRLTVAFPYVSLLSETQTLYPLTLPATYAGGTGGWPLEAASGLLPTVPLTLSLFALPWFWRRRDRETHGATLAAGLFALAGLLSLVLVTTGMWLTTERYETDYVNYFLIAAFLAWAVLWTRSSGHRGAQSATVIGGMVLTALGAAVGLAISLTGAFNLLQLEHPGLFDSLEDTFSPVPTLVARVLNEPMIAGITGPYVQVPTDIGPFDIQESGATVTLARKPTTFTLEAPSTATYYLVGNATFESGVTRSHAATLKVAGSDTRAYRVSPTDVGQMRIPVELHAGVNRVSLTISGQPTKKALFVFASINVQSERAHQY